MDIIDLEYGSYAWYDWMMGWSMIDMAKNHLGPNFGQMWRPEEGPVGKSASNLGYMLIMMLRPRGQRCFRLSDGLVCAGARLKT